MSRFLLLLFLVPALLSARNADDPTAATYRTSVSEVRVTFFTTDESSNPVATVDKDDFAIVDSGVVVRDFRSLSRSDRTTLDVIVVVDASESVVPRFQTTIKDVLQLVSQKELASDDRVTVMSFAGLQPAVICSGNCRSLAGNQRLLAKRPEGPTPLFDTLAYSANFISHRRTPEVRPVIVLFSDGNDNISMASAEDAQRALISSGARLYAIDMNQSGRPSSGTPVLQHMADATGGRYFSGPERGVNVLQSALEDLRASYVVTYQVPDPVAGFHSLRILPRHNLKLRFHCRNGYYFGTNHP